MAKATTYISPAGFKALKDEFDYLKSVERPRVVNEVAEAAAQGDRSENAEYIYGKRRLREIDRRLRFLLHNFNNLQIIDPKLDRGDRVYFGATVTLLDNDTGEEIRYQILGPLDSLDDEHISYRSPVGAVLLGKCCDDEVTIKTPTKRRSFTIIELSYE
ncbi:MAG: GreA/GreB family elongation factor [Bradymonadia bacterium]|jgi:transcription elongation factor GreB